MYGCSPIQGTGLYFMLKFYEAMISELNLGILKVACQKKLQEDGRGGEGGTADNI